MGGLARVAAQFLLTLGGATAYTQPSHSPATILETVQQLLDGDIDLDLKRGGPQTGMRLPSTDS